MKATRFVKLASLVAFLGASAFAMTFDGSVGISLALAQTGPSTTPTARAKAIMRDVNGVTRGTISIVEHMDYDGAYVDHRIDISGALIVPVGVLAAGVHGFHLWEGDCSRAGQAYLNLPNHLDLAGNGHPQHTGDLPNITVANGRASIRFSKITNRFGVSNTSDELNAWDSAFNWGGYRTVAIGIDAGPASESAADAQPVLCGELQCDSVDCYNNNN